jgi:hypothetical protein
MMRIGVSVYEPEQAAAALREYARVVPTLPRTVGWHAALKHDMPALPFVQPEYVGKRLLMLVSMWLDDAEDPAGAETIGRLTETGEPCIKAGTVLPFAAGVQRLIDVEFEDGHRYYTKEAHVADLADDAIDKLDAFWRHDMPMEGEVEIIGLGGAIGDVAEADSAFSNRGYLLWLNFAMRWDDPADDEDYIVRTRNAVAGLAPWTGRGVYVNMLNFDEQDRVCRHIQTKLLDLRRVLDPIEVDMPNRWVEIFIWLDDCKAWAWNLAGVAERFDKASGKRGFAHAQGAGKRDHISGTGESREHCAG